MGLHGGVHLTRAVTEQKLSEWCLYALKANVFKLLQGAQTFYVTPFFSCCRMWPEWVRGIDKVLSASEASCSLQQTPSLLTCPCISMFNPIKHWVSLHSLEVNRTLPRFSQVIKVAYLKIWEGKTEQFYCVQLFHKQLRHLFSTPFKLWSSTGLSWLGTSAPLNLKELPQLCVKAAFA